MARTFKNLILVLILVAVIRPGLSFSAEEAGTGELITRPVMEYKSTNLRDPFITYLAKDEPVQVQVAENQDIPKPEFDLSKLKLQGVIWGGRLSQAIINDKVFRVGDLVEGAEIVSIDKKGVILNFNGLTLNLSAPGQSAVKVNPK
jgi:hypothetical protein